MYFTNSLLMVILLEMIFWSHAKDEWNSPHKPVSRKCVN